MSERKIDIYNHVMPNAVGDRIRELAPGKGDMVKRVTSIPMLHDIEARVRMMDRWPNYQQVLTLSNPPIETIAGPADTPDLARVANDELKKICDARPDKFPAWVAWLPLNNVEASLEEIDRAVALGARGIQILTNVNGRPLDDPEFLPIFAHATDRHGVPIWMHRARRAGGRLPRRGEVEIRDLAAPGLALRDERRNGAPRLFRDSRPAARDADHHPSSGCDDPLFRRSRRTAMGPARHANLGRGLQRNSRRDEGEGAPTD